VHYSVLKNFVYYTAAKNIIGVKFMCKLKILITFVHLNRII